MPKPKAKKKSEKPKKADKPKIHKIIVYSTQSCPWCHKLKEFLDEHSIKYTDYDVSEDQVKAKEMVDKSGQMGVPVIDINGEIIVGFDVERIKELLGIED